MKRILFTLAAVGMFASLPLSAQLIDEKDVTVTMDLQPVLQLDMTTPNQLEFVFDDINEYYAGITKYAATVLKVSSTVSWDLYAAGRSKGTNGPGHRRHGRRFLPDQRRYDLRLLLHDRLPHPAGPARRVPHGR